MGSIHAFVRWSGYIVAVVMACTPARGQVTHAAYRSGAAPISEETDRHLDTLERLLSEAELKEKSFVLETIRTQIEKIEAYDRERWSDLAGGIVRPRLEDERLFAIAEHAWQIFWQGFVAEAERKRFVSTRGLEELTPPEKLLKSWLKDLRHPDPAVRKTLRTALLILMPRPDYSSATRTQFAAIALHLLKSDPDLAVRQRAVLALGGLNRPDEAQIEAMRACLDDEELLSPALTAIARWGKAASPLAAKIRSLERTVDFEQARLLLIALYWIDSTASENQDVAQRFLKESIRSPDPAYDPVLGVAYRWFDEYPEHKTNRFSAEQILHFIDEDIQVSGTLARAYLIQDSVTVDRLLTQVASATAYDAVLKSMYLALETQRYDLMSYWVEKGAIPKENHNQGLIQAVRMEDERFFDFFMSHEIGVLGSGTALATAIQSGKTRRARRLVDRIDDSVALGEGLRAAIESGERGLIDDILPRVSDEKSLGSALISALGAIADKQTASSLIPRVNGIDALAAAVGYCGRKPGFTDLAQQLLDRIVRLSGGHKLADEATRQLGSALASEIYFRRALFEPIFDLVQDEKELEDALLAAVVMDQPGYVERLLTKISDGKLMARSLRKSIADGRQKSFDLILPRISDSESLAAALAVAVSNRNISMFERIIEKPLDSAYLKPALLTAVSSEKQEFLKPLMERIDDVPMLEHALGIAETSQFSFSSKLLRERLKRKPLPLSLPIDVLSPP